MATWRLVREFAGFIRERRRYVLIPLALALLLVGALVVLAQTSPVSPFIYTLF